jgi:DNA polymerase epsilon subunit 1
MKFAIAIEGGLQVDEIINYDVIKKEIVERLQTLCRTPKRKEKPLIYHVDVAAMYPNIILTNRLQPPSIVNDMICSACLFNQPENRWYVLFLSILLFSVLEKHTQFHYHEINNFGQCENSKKKMAWEWRVDYMPLNRNEFETIKNQLEFESQYLFSFLEFFYPFNRMIRCLFVQSFLSKRMNNKNLFHITLSHLQHNVNFSKHD